MKNQTFTAVEITAEQRDNFLEIIQNENLVVQYLVDETFEKYKSFNDRKLYAVYKFKVKGILLEPFKEGILFLTFEEFKESFNGAK